MEIIFDPQLIASLLGFTFLVLYFLMRDYIIPVIVARKHRNKQSVNKIVQNAANGGNGYEKARAFVSMDKKIEDLHKWHSPDTSGVQTWKNPDLTKKTDKLITVVTSLCRKMDKMLVQLTKN